MSLIKVAGAISSALIAIERVHRTVSALLGGLWSDREPDVLGAFRLRYL